jgi:hypothetical protein
MCPFHNVNCPHGFILAAPTADLKVCNLPAQVRRGGWLRGFHAPRSEDGWGRRGLVLLG